MSDRKDNLKANEGAPDSWCVLPGLACKCLRAMESLEFVV